MVLSGYKLGKLAVESDETGLCTLDDRQFVYHIGQPLALFLPTDMAAPQGVLQRLVTHAYFCG